MGSGCQRYKEFLGAKVGAEFGWMIGHETDANTVRLQDDANILLQSSLCAMG